MDAKKRIIIPLSEDDKEDIRKMFTDGKSTIEISEYIGCSRNTVYYHLQKMNLTGCVKWTEGLDCEVINYYKAHLTKKEISSLLGLPVKRVSHRIGYLQKLGKL